jgi:pimeloyl-ACP methyl ester carboxylesterase
MNRLHIVSLCLALSLAAVANGAASAAGTHAYLMRGIFNVSIGLDALAGKLSRRGISASVYGNDDDAAVAAEAIQAYRSGQVRSIVLIGHSLGAAAVVSVARQLNTAGVPVALLVSLDPVSSGSVPPNVRRAVNYYISGSGVPVGADTGFRGNLQNQDLSGVPAMDHMAIQATDAMHNRIIGLVTGTAGAERASGGARHAIHAHGRHAPSHKG